MEKKIKIKRIIWIVLLILAILSFVITLGVGIWHSIFGIHYGSSDSYNIGNNKISNVEEKNKE
ncbi:MAG: hypothetical protein IJ272_07810 [Clostridia bacterium]|nr:hypothetical protein [Clostridia bacterium]